MTRFPENIGIYESMLEMSICRGDIPSAKLAYRAISLFHPYPLKYFSFLLGRIATSYFSIFPNELLHLDLTSTWAVISAMCEADLDRRAYVTASLYLKNGVADSHITHDLDRWIKANRGFEAPSYLVTSIDRLTFTCTMSMNRVISDLEYFQFSGIPLEEIENISDIRSEYYLGKKSWLRRIVKRSLSVYSGIEDKIISNMIDILEVSYTDKPIQYAADFWIPYKKIILGGEENVSKLEELWTLFLRSKALSLITEARETRPPTPKLG